jgi:hypothetical protein
VIVRLQARFIETAFEKKGCLRKQKCADKRRKMANPIARLSSMNLKESVSFVCEDLMYPHYSHPLFILSFICSKKR